MLKSLRAAGVVLALLVATLVGSVPATAAVPTPGNGTGYACLDEEAGYESSAVCQLVVLEMTPICRDDAPWLTYALKPEGTPNLTASITFGNPSGEHVTYDNLPLSGEILWPGAVVDQNGEATDWPGWRLVNGEWVQGDEYSWARPQVQVLFQVNPETQLVAAYPPAVAGCNPNPPTTAVLAEDDPSDPTTTTTSVVLAETGATGTPQLLLTAAGVLLAGSLLLGLRAAMRRRAALR